MSQGCPRTLKRALYERDVVATPLLPGLDLPLARIFRD